MRDLRNLYVAICDNEVRVFDTNLKDFHAKLEAIEPGIKNYQHYYRQFKQKELKSVKYENEQGLKYTLQKVL